MAGPPIQLIPSAAPLDRKILPIRDWCWRCCQIANWFTAEPNLTTSSRPGTRDVFHICNLNMTVRHTSCPLCDFLFNVASDAASLAGLPGAVRFGMYSLHASKYGSVCYDLSENHLGLNTDGEPTVLYIAPLFAFGPKARDWALRFNSCFMSFIGGARPAEGIFACRLGPQADLRLVKKWVQHCNRCHAHEDCNAVGSPPGFMVIDCRTRQLVVLQDRLPYVTLSYVWGDAAAQPASYHADGMLELPPILPKLIEDAIAVALSLDYRYLWIDRYCIPQNDGNVKNNLIRTMDRIYSESSLTIIASASSHPGQGLIGVGRDRESLPQTCHLGGEFGLTQIHTNLGREVGQSLWNTRGWTYQEGFLSNRRLVFTQSQCYFECGEMQCREAIHIPLDTLTSLTRGNKSRLAQVFPWVANKRPQLSTEPCDRRAQAEVYFIERLREYMNRELTHDSDAIDAFSGVLNYLEHSAAKFLLGNILGLPVWSPGSRWLTMVERSHDALMYSLAWTIPFTSPVSSDDRTLSHFMRSFSDNVAERRREFPSWSWSGWKLRASSARQIEWDDTRSSQGADDLLPDSELAIECGNGDLIPWRKSPVPFELMLNGIQRGSAAKYIRVRGWISDLHLPGNGWYSSYDNECQCGPYRLKRRDVQYLSMIAERWGAMNPTTHECILKAWFFSALSFNKSDDCCRTKVMVLLPVADVQHENTYERADLICPVKMKYFVGRMSIDSMAQRCDWDFQDLKIR